jgi:uncharacterized protein YjbJ (UPF0337 family)
LKSWKNAVVRVRPGTGDSDAATACRVAASVAWRTDDRAPRPYHGLHEQESDMDWNDIAGQWKSFRPTIRQQWSRLTETQLDAVGGSRELLIRTIRQVYSISQEQTEKQVAAWVKRLPPSVARAPEPVDDTNHPPPGVR